MHCRKKQNGKNEGRKPNHSSCREKQTSIAKENRIGIDAEKSQVSILENQTIVTYTGDELVSFKDNMVSRNTKKTYEYIRAPFAVLIRGKTRQTN